MELKKETLSALGRMTRGSLTLSVQPLQWENNLICPYTQAPGSTANSQVTEILSLCNCLLAAGNHCNKEIALQLKQFKINFV